MQKATAFSFLSGKRLLRGPGNSDNKEDSRAIGRHESPIIEIILLEGRFILVSYFCVSPKDHATLLFIGDSITDTGRAYPVGELAGLGDGYVSLVDGLIAARSPKNQIRILNTGVGGNRIIDLEARWKSDAIDLSPDWRS